RAELQAPGRKRSSPATKRRHSNRFAERRRLAHRVGTRCGLRTIRRVARDGGRPCQPRRDGVYPVGGWWKEKPFPERFDTLARYSLIVTMRAPGSDVDIDTPGANCNCSGSFIRKALGTAFAVELAPSTLHLRVADEEL